MYNWYYSCTAVLNLVLQLYYCTSRLARIGIENGHTEGPSEGSECTAMCPASMPASVTPVGTKFSTTNDATWTNKFTC